MNVFEFIREKTEGFQENATEFRAKLEPRFRNWSNTINDKITNTLNNPWITNLNPFDKKVTSSSETVITNKVTEKIYKELKEINPTLLIVYLDGDSHMNFPTYTQWFINDIDLFVSVDSIDVSDFVAQLGCRSICLGNTISDKDFYPIQGINKDITITIFCLNRWL